MTTATTSRRLKSSTIIPPELYIRRKADNQLRDIISDMGRPGYVLVARQMGKTNLLLNAKRELPSGEDLYVYLDVSNVFPDVRGFFRNLTDTALEGLSHKDVFVRGEIEQDRASSNLLPHKEHERELKRLLGTVSGKLVFFLDEIDALTKTTYSDQVFSFIRSVYFSGRANNSEFERLTYVLSGVAEPGELIRNKAISPFNIGEKIYLDDFTREEFDAFIEGAGLPYSEIVQEKIFAWTEGNPRMTWDLCSALERLEVAVVSPEHVDATVHDLYFSSLDVPPIDHIKSLVEQSSELREAVMAIHYGKADGLSGSARTKLYLAGISRFDPESRSVAFKNKVVELALSEDFVRSVEGSNTTPLEAGYKLFEIGQYSEARAVFTSIFRHGDASQRALGAYWAALSSFRLAEYEEALNYFDESRGLPDNLQRLRSHYKGLSHLHLKQLEQAITSLEEVAAGSERDVFHFEAKVNIAAAKLLIPDSHSRAKEFREEGIAESEEILAASGELLQLDAIAGKSFIVRAQLNLARALWHQRLTSAALGRLESAKELANAEERLELLVFQVAICDPRDRETVLSAAMDAVYEIKSFSIKPRAGEHPSLDDVPALLDRMYRHGRTDDIPRVLDHVFDHLAPDQQVVEVVNHVLYSLIERGDQNLSGIIVSAMLRRAEVIRAASTYRSVLAIAILLEESAAHEHGGAFIGTFSEDSLPAPTDLRVLNAIVAAALRHGLISLAEAAVELAIRVSTSEHPESAPARSIDLLQQYLKVLVQLRRDADESAIKGASLLLNSINRIRAFEVPYLPKTYPGVMQTELLTAVRLLSPTTPIRVEKKFGRNQMVVVDYQGVKRTGKYKKFADDLAAGLCVLVGPA
jgi:tetratricopeptide (TPR) repeat protein